MFVKGLFIFSALLAFVSLGVIEAYDLRVAELGIENAGPDTFIWAIALAIGAIISIIIAGLLINRKERSRQKIWY